MNYRKDLIDMLVDTSKQYPTATICLSGENLQMPMCLTVVSPDREELREVSDIYNRWVIEKFPSPEERDEEMENFSTYARMDLEMQDWIPADWKIQGGVISGSSSS